MAKQKSVLTLTGRLGDRVYYKTPTGYYARQSPRVKIEENEKPNSDNLSRQNREFAVAATMGKRIRSLFQPVIDRVGDPTFNQRLCKRLMQIQQIDGRKEMGERQVESDNWGLLKNLKLNSKKSFYHLYATDIRVEEDDSKIVLELAACHRMNNDFPPNATHFRMFLAAASMSMEGKEEYVYEEDSHLIKIEDDLPALTFELEKSKLRGSLTICILSIQFFQSCGRTLNAYCSKNYLAGKVVHVWRKK